MPEATSKVKHEVHMKVKVLRKDGSVEELDGNEVTEVELPEDLILEYKKITKRAKEIEALLLEYMMKQDG